ncbi:phage recombination protein Bet [Tepidimicrobium xylanilyticum]
MSNIVKYETDNGEVTLSKDIVKRYLVSGDASKVTDQEVMMFIQMCKYQNLNPFLREAYLIKFGNTPATMVTGKDTFVKRAAKSKLCTGYEAGVIVQKEDGTVEYRKGALVLPKETLVGGWARVYRKDWEVPMEIAVGLEEYQRYNNKGDLMINWQKMPATMIRKVALVQALREAIPEEFGGLYSPEEMPIDDSALDSTPVNVEASIENKSEKEELNDLASQKQLNYIYSLASQKNIDSEKVKQIMQEQFGKNSSKELTKTEASKLIEILQNYEEIEEADYKDIDFDESEFEGTPFED